MRSMAKAILISILSTIGFLLFVNFIYFFPWYMTLVVETFNLSQAAANDNYVKYAYYDDVLDRIRERPIFRDRPYDVEITVTNSSGKNAVGYDDALLYVFSPDYDKPYRQRGEPVTITIEAVYPLKVTLWGNEIRRDLDVSFTMKAIGLKHYKDLELD